MYLEKEPIPYGPDQSFASIRFEGPKIICPYHCHPEVVLVSLPCGNGKVVVGNFTGTFHPGDVFLLGANLPHYFQSGPDRGLARTHVVQFRPTFCGPDLLELPEFRRVRRLLERAQGGLRVRGATREVVRQKMESIHGARGPMRILELLALLVFLAETKSLETLSSLPILVESEPDGRMARVMAYIYENLTDRLTVEVAAQKAGLTPNAFCRYFKQQTRRTFTDLVNELRIREACRLLRDTTTNVAEIALAAGFSNLAHFYTEFRRRCGLTPSAYRAGEFPLA